MKVNSNRKGKIILKVLVTLLALVVAAGIILACYYLIKPAYGEVETVTVGNSKTLTVGVISDTQLPNKEPEDGNNKYKEHTEKALQLFKNQGVDVIVFAGDFSDLASRYSYGTYNEVFNKVFADDKPETVYIMGNHDNWYPTDYASVAPKERLYKKCMGESPWVHKVINGFHFIGVSPDLTQNTSGYSQKTLDWMDEQIALAQKDTPEGYPIFVITHHSPQNTVYGSDDWYDPGLDKVLSKYENVVSISGHSHYSLMDERSIYQYNYTAIQTQSLAYIEQEKGKFDAFKAELSSIPPKADDYPFAIIMKVGEDKTTVERWKFWTVRKKKQTAAGLLIIPLIRVTSNTVIIQDFTKLPRLFLKKLKFSMFRISVLLKTKAKHFPVFLLVPQWMTTLFSHTRLILKKIREKSTHIPYFPIIIWEKKICRTTLR